jgi:SAM-dependent methyltransferase
LTDTEHTCCPLCRADQALPWGAENGWTAVKCQLCGLVYVSPRPSPERIEAATALGLHPGRQSTLDVRGGFEPRKVAGLRVRLRQQYPGDELRRRPFRWLDVGAGYGELLLALRDLAPAGTTLAGVEACRPKVEALRRLGLDLTASSLADVNGPYDYISLVNVLSHLPDPQRFFCDVAALLSPRGEMLVVTGNAGDIPRSEYPQALRLPDHLVFAGAAHLRTMLERAGCDIVSENAYRTSMPRSRIEQWAEAGLARLLGRRVGYSGAFRSLWLRARRR